MKLQYLGTGAAEGIPAMYCQCETCKRSFALGGKNIRTRSQALIDGKILIDLPADTYMHFLQNKLDSTSMVACIITHSHGDHLYAREMTMRRVGFVDLSEEKPLSFYGTSVVYAELAELYQQKLAGNAGNRNRVAIHQITPFTPFEVDGYKITPLKAYHDAKTDPVFYAVEKDGTALLYGHDTGPFPQETWNYLKNSGIKFHAVSLDSTYATLPGDNLGGHMNLTVNRQVKEQLLFLGLADENTLFVVNHFSHKNGTHHEIQAKAEEFGFLTAYDGMTLNF